MSANRGGTRVATLARIGGDDRGETLIGFGLVMPILVLLSLGILEFSVLVFDYHRAAEATRRGARLAAISEPVADLGGFARGSVVSCGSASGTTSCTGASVSAAATFESVVWAMQDILPAVSAANIQIEYSDSGLGDPTSPGGIVPVITVRLVGLDRPFLLLGGFPGLGAGVTFPPFTANQIGGGIGPTGS